MKKTLLFMLSILFYLLSYGQTQRMETAIGDFRYNDITLDSKTPTITARISALSRDRVWIDNNMTMRPFKEQVINILAIGYKLQTKDHIEVIPYLGMRHEFNNTRYTNDARAENVILIGGRFQYYWIEKSMIFTVRRAQLEFARKIVVDIRTQFDYVWSMKCRIGTLFDTKYRQNTFQYVGGLTFGYKPFLKKKTILQAGWLMNTKKQGGFQLRIITGTM